MSYNENGFSYTYSAAQKEEIENIRKKYSPKEEDKMSRLRRLDEGVTRKATAIAMTLGIIGTLVTGTGMSLVMTDIGAFLGDLYMMVGILIGLVGIAMVSMAYPAYVKTVKKEREKIAPEIIRLTDELMNE